MPLTQHITELLRQHHRLTLAEYMELCLYHPQYGYYRTRQPLGKDGDFTTSPEISQLFGEMLGIWLISRWQAMGEPSRFLLLEAGPGRGTLMADILRTIQQLAPGMLTAADIRLIEVSEALMEVQQQKLAPYSITWQPDFTTLPDLPMLMVANEFFDALPIQQFRKYEGDWQEKYVVLEDGKLAWAWGDVILTEVKDNDLLEMLRAIQHDIIEICPAAQSILSPLSQHIAMHGGAALIIDYGYTEGHGDTFQALRHHAYAEPLKDCGMADLTAHVDFAALQAIAEQQGAKVFSAIPQGVFLQRMGIQLRAAMLCKKAIPEQQEKLLSDVVRLTSAEGMGELFKCMVVQHPNLSLPEGFYL